MCMYVCVYVRVCVCAYVRACMCACIYIFMYVRIMCVYVCDCVCMHVFVTSMACRNYGLYGWRIFYRDEAETTYIDAYNRGRQIRQASSDSGHKLSLLKVSVEYGLFVHIQHSCVCVSVFVCTCNCMYVCTYVMCDSVFVYVVILTYIWPSMMYSMLCTYVLIYWYEWLVDFIQ